jgi:hypothetical protein
MGREAVWVDEIMVVPSGRMTEMGSEVGLMSVTGPVTWM